MSTENNSTSHFSLKSILEKDKLNHSNFMDWHRNLKIVLKAENKLYVLEEPVPDEPINSKSELYKTWAKHFDDSLKVSCLMLAFMIPELQRTMEDMDAYDMNQHLMEMFQQNARHERFDMMRSLITTRMQEGSPVCTHVLKMKEYVDHLARLESPLSDELAGDIILNSLPKSYDQFIMNYNMNGMEKTLAELHQMLKTAEVNIPGKTASVLMIREGQIKKPKTKKKGYQGKGKGKGKAVANKKPLKDAKCFHCDETRHWKRNCAKYLAELKQAKASGGESSGIYVIEIFVFSGKTWVFDTGCGFHTCNVLQGLRKIRKLKQGEIGRASCRE